MSEQISMQNNNESFKSMETIKNFIDDVSRRMTPEQVALGADDCEDCE